MRKILSTSAMLACLVPLTPDGLAASVQPCGTNSIPVDRVVGVKRDDAILMGGPGSIAEPLINQTATAAFHKMMYLQIDRSVKVREKCREAGWSRVRVVDPDYMSGSHFGWVSTATLQVDAVAPSANREFTE